MPVRHVSLHVIVKETAWLNKTNGCERPTHGTYRNIKNTLKMLYNLRALCGLFDAYKIRVRDNVKILFIKNTYAPNLIHLNYLTARKNI